MSESNVPTAPTERINPFIYVWLNPRGAMRSHLNEGPRRFVRSLILLSYVAIIAADMAPNTDPLPSILIFGLPIALVSALLVYFLYAPILNSVCQSLRGLGELQETRAAIAWSLYVRAGTSILQATAFILAVRSTGEIMAGAIDAPVVVVVRFGLAFALFVYGLVISTLLIAEAHQFEWWKGLLSAIMTRILLAILTFLIMLPIGFAMLAMGYT
jgi:hypothetical protein